MGIPCLWVREEIAAKAHICWIVLATYSMGISQVFAICVAHHTKRGHEFLRAIRTSESVGRIPLTCHGMLVPGNAVRKDGTAKAYVPWIILAGQHMSVSQ